MAIGALYDANNVVVGQAAVFVAPMGTALPALTGWNTSDPFDPAYWEASGSLWTPVGATEQGWQLGAQKSTQSINIEEQSTPVGETIANQSITLQGSLSEDISATLALAMNATIASTAPTSTAPGYDTITPSDVPIYWAVACATTNAAREFAQVATLSTALTTGAPITALAVTAIPAALKTGAVVQLVSGSSVQQFTLTAPATAGDVSLTVASQTPNFAYPTTTKVETQSQPGSLGRIHYAPKWTSLGNISTAFRRAAGQRAYAASFATVCPTSQIQIINFTQPIAS